MYNQCAAFHYIGLNYFEEGHIETAAKLFRKSLSGFVRESPNFIEGIIALLHFITLGALYPCLLSQCGFIALSMLACCLHQQRNFSENLHLWLQIRSMLMRNNAVMSVSMAKGEYYI